MSNAKKAPKAPKAVEEGLIRVKKGEETLDIHPTCLEDHKSLGWVEVEVEPIEPDDQE